MIVSIRQITNVEQTAVVLLLGSESLSDETNSSIFKADYRSILNSQSNSLTKFNKMMLILLDSSFWILRLLTNKYFAVFILCARRAHLARCLNSMVTLQ